MGKEMAMGGRGTNSPRAGTRGRARNIDSEFARFDADTRGRKTGVFGEGVDMYTRRTGDRERVFRVSWSEPRYASREAFEAAMENAGRKPSSWSFADEYERNEVLFPYTGEGLARALEFSSTRRRED